MVLNAVRERLTDSESVLWDKQVGEINKVQRLPDGVEANFYRMKGGSPSFDDALAFGNQAEELLVATVRIRIPNVKEALIASVWCVRGFLFSIEYMGSVKYFEEAAGMEPVPSIEIECKIESDLSKAP